MSGTPKDCRCCSGMVIQTPVNISNRPGLSAVACRAGTYSQFRQSMHAMTSAAPALRGLSSRSDDDFSMALLDAWSVVADILTFYQERIANESYLRTATEKVSLQQLSRLIGYEIRPGVAASTYLAFTLEDARGAPPQAIIDKGTRAQTTPGQDEKAQSFETIESIQARPEWNAIKPRMTQPQEFNVNLSSITVDGINTNLRQGDRLLIAAEMSSPVLQYVDSLEIDFDAKKTRIFLQGQNYSDQKWDQNYADGKITDQIVVELNDYFIRDYVMDKIWIQEDLISLAKTNGWSLDSLKAIISRQVSLRKTSHPIAENVGVFAMRQSAAIFGNNAPLYNSLPPDPFKTVYPNSWESWDLQYYSDNSGSPPGEVYIYLDRTYSGIIPGSWIILLSPSPIPLVLNIKSIDEISSTDFALSMKVSRLTIDNSKGSANNLPAFKIRETSALIQSERLNLTDVPIMETVDGTQLMLDGFYPGLMPGRNVIITGEVVNGCGFKVSYLATLGSVTVQDGFTTLDLIFNEPIGNSFIRKTVSINANVALATHGESVQEVLGSGNASSVFQSFILHQSPLTYIQSSENDSGAKSTLDVRVNDLLWREVPSLYGHGPEEHIYIIRTGDDGKATIIFGDGRTGARLPNGKNNVRASYRKGIGLDGVVEAGKINLLMSRPLGVRDVLNPLSASGGENSESLELARLNAPLEILTLGRIVSLKDYEDFARAYAGIAKAVAVWVWDGRRKEVTVIAAGPNGEPISLKTANSLAESMKRLGNPHVPINIDPEKYSRVFFGLKATVKISPDYLQEETVEEAKSRLKDHYSFEARSFGQAVTIGEIMGVIQSVPGIEAIISVDALHRLPLSGDPFQGHLNANMPGSGSTSSGLAELLVIDHDHISLETMK